jgi:uncharacterized protein (DUF2147 family)
MRVRFALAFAASLPLIAPVIASGQAMSPTTSPTTGQATTGATTPAGLWQAVDDDTKQPSGWFVITNHDGVYTGIIAKMFMKPGDPPNPVCDKCTDDRQNHPWLGLEIIRDTKQEQGDKYSGGNILDPRDGKVYHVILTLSPDGQTLTVHGYLGIPLLGKNVYWTRLPDTAYSMLDPSLNPNAKRPPGGAMAPPQHKSDAPHPQNNTLGLRQ